MLLIKLRSRNTPFFKTKCWLALLIFLLCGDAALNFLYIVVFVKLRNIQPKALKNAGNFSFSNNNWLLIHSVLFWLLICLYLIQNRIFYFLLSCQLIVRISSFMNLRFCNLLRNLRREVVGVVFQISEW